MAPKEKQVATPTSKFTFGSGFQKYDLGAAGDQPNQPVVASTSPSAGFTLGDTAAEATETGVSIRARFSKVSNRGVISLFLVPVSGF